MDVDVTAVPRREPGMSPVEVMTSESQERMLAIVDARVARRGRRRSAARWEVEATAIGVVDRAGRAGAGRAADPRRRATGRCWPTCPRSSLADDAPLTTGRAAPADLARARVADDPSALPAPADPGEDLLALLVDPRLSTASTTTSCSSTPSSARARATPRSSSSPAPGIPWRSKGSR